MTKVALFQPDIAGNVGTIIRTCVGFDVELHIIEPCGFPFDMQRVKKSALDYIFKAQIFRHASFDDFYKSEIKEKNQRLVLAPEDGWVTDLTMVHKPKLSWYPSSTQILFFVQWERSTVLWVHLCL